MNEQRAVYFLFIAIAYRTRRDVLSLSLSLSATLVAEPISVLRNWQRNCRELARASWRSWRWLMLP